jgi:hypothetical protein
LIGEGLDELAGGRRAHAGVAGRQGWRATTTGGQQRMMTNGVEELGYVERKTRSGSTRTQKSERAANSR